MDLSRPLCLRRRSIALSVWLLRIEKRKKSPSESASWMDVESEDEERDHLHGTTG